MCNGILIFFPSNFLNYPFNLGVKYWTKEPGITQTREWGAGCDVKGEAVVNFCIAGEFDELFLKLSLEPKGLKGKSITSYEKKNRGYYEYFINISIPSA